MRPSALSPRSSGGRTDAPGSARILRAAGAEGLRPDKAVISLARGRDALVPRGRRDACAPRASTPALRHAAGQEQKRGQALNSENRELRACPLFCLVVSCQFTSRCTSCLRLVSSYCSRTCEASCAARLRSIFSSRAVCGRAVRSRTRPASWALTTSGCS